MAITSQTIANLAKAIPALDAEARQRADAARQIQMSQATSGLQTAGTTPGAPTGRAAAQQLAAAGVEAKATDELSARQRMLQNLQEVGGQALQAAGAEEATRQGQAQLAGRVALSEAGREAQAGIGAAERAQKIQFTKEEVAQAERLQKVGIDTEASISFLTNKQREDLAKLGGDLKQQLFDSRLQFERDELGRKFSNDRQMADWAIVSAKSKEDLMNKMQSIQQAQQKELVMLKAAHARLTQALQQGFADEQRELDQASKARMIQAKADLEKKMQEKEAAAARMGNIISGVASGAMAGASVGGFYGAIIGGAAGGVAAAGANKQSTGSYV